MIATRTICVAVAAAMALSGVASAFAEGFDAEPYKLVRSLQRLQDEIADGDKSALGMQREMAKLIDDSFRKIDTVTLREPKNARALLAYAMAGGNPKTLEERLADLGKKDDEIVRLAVAILVYQKGAGRTAEARLRDVDPMKVDGLLGAYLALVRGLVSTDDDKARVDFDNARLLAPGTLVEEAALRRLMVIHKRRQDAVSFLRVSSRYVRRYIASPYAVQFATEFVGGVIALDSTIDVEGVIEVISFLKEPYRSAIMVRLMRSATIAGHTELVRRLAELAPEGAEIAAGADFDPEIEARQKLYAQISQVTSENIREVAAELARIDRARLSDGDRELLDAVIAIATAVMNPEPTVTAAIGAETAPEPRRESIFRDPENTTPDNGIPAFEDYVGGMRATLDDIDKLLKDVQ